MEPSELTPQDPAEARIEALLRASAPAPLANDGFSNRLLAALPPSAAVAPWWKSKKMVLILATAMGLLIAVAKSGLGNASAIIDAPAQALTSTLAGLLGQREFLIALAVIAGAWALSDEIAEPS